MNSSILPLSPLARDWLKVIAFMAMVIDHATIAFNWQPYWLHLVGRLAMPLFALVWGCNLATHSVKQASLNRLWIWALVAQPFYWLALHPGNPAWYQLNILFLFAVSGQLLLAWEKQTLQTVCLAVSVIAAYVPLSAFSYGMRGLLLMAVSVMLYRASSRWQMLALLLWLSGAFLLNLPNGFPMALASLCGPVICAGLLTHYLPENSRRLSVTRGFASAYALHLAVLTLTVATG